MYKKTKHIHFVGIGGIGMSGIAELLLLDAKNMLTQIITCQASLQSIPMGFPMRQGSLDKAWDLTRRWVLKMCHKQYVLPGNLGYTCSRRSYNRRDRRDDFFHVFSFCMVVATITYNRRDELRRSIQSSRQSYKLIQHEMHSFE